VTGVQTCALPIFRRRRAPTLRRLTPAAGGAAGRVQRVPHADVAGLERRGPRLRLPGPHDAGPGRAPAAARAVGPGRAATVPGTPRPPLPGRRERRPLLP